ncbi:aldose epimerase family protein [Ascidiimonas sp. W6]|uniref:aldose epimerase family protein n=1 Tax=Ascidiimonas meishanensis TaxID=3128903 RepID=UPI0030EE8B1A
MPNNQIIPYQITTDSIKLTALNYGAIIKKLEVKNNQGEFLNIVINFKNNPDYYNNPKYLGACVGRYAGRIANGIFNLNSKEIHLDNQNGVHLHGGKNGWSMQYWELEELNDSNPEPFVRFRYICKHSDTGYPGNVEAFVTYKITKNNSLVILHEAETDRDTILNLTNHSYFNLSGNGKSIDTHLLKVNADSYLETNKKLVPTGNILSVSNTEKDFRQKRPIMLTRVDDTFIFKNNSSNQIEIEAPDTGIKMLVTTNQPAAVIFTPDSFPAICFETQNYPDAPNHSNFPSSILKAGENYINKSVFQFLTKS